MDGLRELATSSCTRLSLGPPCKTTTNFTALSITPTETSFDVRRAQLAQEDLPGFFQHGFRKGVVDSLRLIVVPTDEVGKILVDDPIWHNVLLNMHLDPWVEHQIRNCVHGFNHSIELTDDGEVGSNILTTTTCRNVWTTKWEPSSEFYATRYVVIDRRAVNQKFHHPLVTDLFHHMDIFKSHSCSALYLPLVLAVGIIHYREKKLIDNTDLVRTVEARTGHGCWGTGTFEAEDGRTITKLTAQLGDALVSVGSAWKHLNMAEKVFVYMEDFSARMQHSGALTSQRTKQSDADLMAAVPLLRQQAEAAKEQCNYIELRVKNQSQVLFSFLTHQDSMVNIQVANASRDLAEAARRDGSSMKTIAVLTMAFLPATFMAALFAVPAMRWEEVDNLAVIYWASVACITLATFVLWAGITQRQQIVELVRG